jgi:transcriptional regulator NrdR family protein
VFTSIEKANLSASLVVRKQKGVVEPFSRDKLLLSVYDSLRHRKTALGDAVALCDTVINRLLPKVDQATIEVSAIAEVAYSVLKRFDRVSATHYQAFHPVSK